MLTGLDPHSNYMNAKAFRDMQVQTRGEFGGLGIEVTQENGLIKVISPIDDTPASRAGIKPGDLILALDGKTVQGLSLNDAVDKMRGPPNSKIKLTIKREGVDQPFDVTLTREVIQIQVVKSHLEGGDIGYIRITSFNEQTDSGLRKAMQQLQAAGRRQAARRWCSTCATTRAACSTRRSRSPTTSSTRARSSPPAPAIRRTASAGTPRAATSPTACRWWC